MQLLVSDANIFIDLEEGELLELFFQLPYDFCVPDILYYEELEEHHAHLLSMGLLLKELSADSLLEVGQVQAKYVGPSTNDIFALLLAKQEQCPLLSGDQALRAAAESEYVDIRGTLWVVEEMVRHGLIAVDQALEAYKKMEDAGRRLPWAEARRRIRNI